MPIAHAHRRAAEIRTDALYFAGTARFVLFVYPPGYMVKRTGFRRSSPSFQSMTIMRLYSQLMWLLDPRDALPPNCRVLT